MNKPLSLVLVLTMALGAAPIFLLTPGAMVRFAHAADPCCSITAIDANSQTVTAKEMKTGRTFQFKVADMKILSSLKVGQAVHADFKTNKVSVNPDGIQPCCSVVNLRAPATAPVR